MTTRAKSSVSCVIVKEAVELGLVPVTVVVPEGMVDAPAELVVETAEVSIMIVGLTDVVVA